MLFVGARAALDRGGHVAADAPTPGSTHEGHQQGLKDQPSDAYARFEPVVSETFEAHSEVAQAGSVIDTGPDVARAQIAEFGLS